MALESILAPLGHRIVQAASGEEAVACLREEDFAVVLLDVMMPGIDGFATADLLRAQERGRHVPIIFLTAGDISPIDGYAHGGVDFLHKPLDAKVVRAKVAVFIELFRARDRFFAQERAAEARNRALLDASLDAVVGMDHAGCITEFNAAAEAMFGHRRADVLGHTMADLVIPEHLRESHRRGLHRYLATGRSRVLGTRIEVDALRADGTVFPVELAIGRIRGEEPPSFLGYIRDISEQRAALLERADLLGRAQRAQAEAEAARAHLQGLFHQVPFPVVVVTGPDHVFTLANDAYLKIIGRSRDDALGRPAREVLPELAPQGYFELLDRVFESGEPFYGREMPVQLRRGDGTFETSYFTFVYAPYRGADGRIAGITGAAFDVTPEVHARQQLEAILAERKRAESVRAFLTQASEVFASSLDYEATLQAIARMAVPHVADWCSVELIDDDPRAPVRLAVAHVDPTKVSLAEELRLRYPPDPDAEHGVPHVLKTGHPELYEDVPDALLERAARDAEHLRILRELGLRSAMVVPITTGGRTLGAISFIAAESGRRYSPSDLVMVEDLARRAGIAIENARLYRAAQAAEARNRFLAEATETLASSLDYATTLERVARLAVPMVADLAAVYRLEPDGAIRLTALAADDPGREALARELDSMLPLRIEQQERLLPRVLRSRNAELLTDVPETTQQAWSPSARAGDLMNQLAIRSYMAVPLLVRGRVLGALALTTVKSGRRLGPNDLTLAKELARRAGLAIENAELYREAQKSNRLKDEFLATVSHELRTPLTAILGWTHLLRSGRPAQVARAIETIERNARAQARIIEDVLDVSRIITGKLGLRIERVNLRDVVQAALDTVRPAAEGKHVELVTTMDPTVGETAGDPSRLQQVVWNVLSNAIKFTSKGGRVEVRLDRHESMIRLRVSDTGQGIRPDFLPHVFERFRQEDSASTRAHGGLGLGLAIVRHLVELHGGHVAADSGGEGLGATFTIMLPIRALTAQPAESESHAAAGEVVGAAASLQGVRALVVDDDADARDLISALLEQHGAEVTAAPSARAALDVLEHWIPNVLVSDLGMPQEDGYSLIRNVRAVGTARGFWFPAVALTAYAQLADKTRALSAGFQAHVTKPVDPDSLVALIAQLRSQNSE